MAQAVNIFGMTVEDIADSFLDAMVKSVDAKANSVFVINVKTNAVNMVMAEELRYVQALKITTHTGSDILRNVKLEIERRTQGRLVITELLHKIGTEPTPEEVERVWSVAETQRKVASRPREVAPRLVLRTEGARSA
jgi:hypothetical protein